MAEVVAREVPRPYAHGSPGLFAETAPRKAAMVVKHFDIGAIGSRFIATIVIKSWLDVKLNLVYSLNLVDMLL